MLVEIDAEHPQMRKVQNIVDVLRRGGVVVYPTDTTYALGCDMDNNKAVQRILDIKRMPKDKLLSLICPDLKVVSQYGYITNQSYKLMKHCLPGPYTFILKATQLVPRKMMTNRKTIGVRIPNNTISGMIVGELGRPIITASVRLGGEEIMSEPIEIENRIGHQVDMVVDSGIILPYPSSVVDLSDDPPVIIREGAGDLSFISTL